MKSELTEAIINYMLEKNKVLEQRSFFFPDEHDETSELVEEGAQTFAIFNEDGTVKACAIADLVENNKTIEISGPFGDTDDRMQLLSEIKEAYPNYRLLLFVTKENQLSEKYKVLSDEYSMEINLQKNNAISDDHSMKIKKSKVDGVEAFDMDKDSLELHDQIFPNSYANSDELIDEFDILVFKAEGKVVGYIAYEKEEAIIDFVAVEDSYRRKGIAQKLLLAALSDMAGEEVPFINQAEETESPTDEEEAVTTTNQEGKVATLTVNSAKTGAIELYKKLGFTLRAHMICLEVV